MKHFLSFLFCFCLFSGLRAQNLPSYLPANGLVGWWPFNGNAQDESGSGNHGTVNGATLTTDRFGNAGKAYYLNGITDFIQTTYSGISSNGSRTVTFWANPEAVASNNYAFSYGGPFPGGIFAATVRCTPSDNIGTVISSAFINFFNPSVCGNWNFYCYSFPPGGQNQSNIKVYQNGLLLTNPTSQFNPTTIVNTANSSPLTFGKLVYVDGYPSNFKGRLDDFGFWNRELSQAEITQLYQAGNESSLSYQLSQEKLGNCANSTVKLSVKTSVKVKTDSAGSIGSNSATAYGTILNDGGKTITRRGFCWGTSANPTLSNSFSENGSGSGTFSGSLSGLSLSTTYYLRAYAGTATEVWYGNEISLSTGSGSASAATCGTPNIHNPNLLYGSMSDQDGNNYKTIVIGTQEWMAENLKTGHYRNGEVIPVVTNDTAWRQLGTGASCWYNNDSTANDCPYGRLYNWYTVADPRGLCPAGWHVPSDGEWTSLEIFLGGSNFAGGKMKAVSSLWNPPNSGATNESGFSAIAGGLRDYDGAFLAQGSIAVWWSSTEGAEDFARDRGLFYDDPISYRNRYFSGKQDAFSIRCLKDAPETGSINSLDCGGAVNAGTIYAGQAASAASTTISYTGGNGGSYNSRSTASTGVTGLTATLAAGNFASGDGSLSFNISGTPTSNGTASFALNIGGQSCTFTKIVVATGGGVTDIDGNSYGSVIIGNQEWMTENLKVSKYRNGNGITTGLSNTAWRNSTSGAYSVYDNSSANNTIHGKLYNWYATVDTRGLCPASWHVPTDHDWQILTKYLDPSGDTSLCCSNSAGGKLKSIGTIEAGNGLWLSPNGGASNESGFNADATGSRNQNGPYYAKGGTGFWWSTTAFSSSKAYFRYIYSGGPVLLQGDNSNGNIKADGFAVRCLKD